MKPQHLLITLLLLLVALAPPARAQTPVEGPPKLIDYQGTALDSNGNPLAPTTPTNYTMQFRLYSTQSGGTPIWSESQTVTVSNGQFSVRLGQGIAIGAEPKPDLSLSFNNKDRYLGLTIVVPPQAPAEITPRLAFLSAPFAFVADRARSADSVSQSAGTSSLGITSITNLTIGGPTKINANNVMEFGGGVAGKFTDAGKIGYGTLTPGTLDITGAGSAAGGADRKVKIWSEGGLTVAGPLSVSGAFSLGGPLSLSGALSLSADETIQPPFSLNFGSTTRQMLNLYSTSFGIGIQGNTLYSRTGSNFAWFAGGVHNDAQNNPGAGGTFLASLSPNGFSLNSGSISVPAGNLSVSGSLNGYTLNINTGLQTAAGLSGNNGTGTWLGLQNTSAGGRTWNLISSGGGNTGGAGKLLVADGGNPLFAFTNAGYLGIGTTNPVAPLHVVKPGYSAGSVFNSNTGYGVFLGGNAAHGGVDGFDSTYADNRTVAYTAIAALFDGEIVAKNTIWVGNALSYSDARAKQIAGVSDGAADLATLRKLEIKDYTWIDRSKDQHRAHKKLIAQEVEQIFPQAVSIAPGPQVIPSVYELAEKVVDDAATGTLTISTGKEHGLAVGDLVDLYDEQSEMKGVKVTAVASPHEFVVARERAAVGKVFVYGKEVRDFRAVDYEAIAMLNVSGTQELARKVSALEQRVAQLEVENKTRDARLTAIEKLLPSRDLTIRKVAQKTTKPAGN
jgi:hypothetical protein